MAARQNNRFSGALIENPFELPPVKPRRIDERDIGPGIGADLAGMPFSPPHCLAFAQSHLLSQRFGQ
ncbi:hypothetical protein [Polaromonas sp. YR568]|uniref:hypothetical protein n=1 Tax=Polaromonas sp. YR568 TaxID=1855301 RepID=UPI00398C1D34